MSYPYSFSHSSNSQLHYQMYLQHLEYQRCMNARYQEPTVQVASGPSSSTIGDKHEYGEKSGRWTEQQTATLVENWKENSGEVESSRNRIVWSEIIKDINVYGPAKNINQAKKKVATLKDQYKRAKENNKKSGASPEFSPFYKEFDEILSARPVAELDMVREVGVDMGGEDEQGEPEEDEVDIIEDENKKKTRRRMKTLQ